MKQAVLLIYAFTVIATLTVADDDVEKLAYLMEMTRTEVQTCFNKTNITPEDLRLIDQLVDDEVHTRLIDKAALKVGCFLTCISQKKGIMSGAHINEGNMKQLYNSRINGNRHLIQLRKKIMDICIPRVRSKTDACEVSIQFFLCAVHETRRYTPST